MAVKIRLTRMGDKKSPFYRVVVADSRSPRDGRFVELVGTYSPLEDSKVKINEDVALKWLNEGAMPTDTVRNILSKEECGAPFGTTITIRELFYNTPVRYKFLKKDFTEAGYRP